MSAERKFCLGTPPCGRRVFFSKDTRWISFISGSNSTFDGSKDSSRQRNSLSVPRRRRQYGVWLHDFFFLFPCSCLILLRCLRALALLFCIFVLLWWWGVSLRLSGVLLRVALKHRGSVAAGSRCGLWPADSVGCGDCGLAGLSRWRHQGVVGWHFCLADRSHTVPRNPSPRRNGILPRRGAARLFKRAHPTRVNKSHHWSRACVSEWVITRFRESTSHHRACVLVSDRRLH